jgi:hypothetical protein
LYLKSGKEFHFSWAIIKGLPFGSSNLSIVFTLNKNEMPNARIAVRIKLDVMAIQMPDEKKPWQ